MSQRHRNHLWEAVRPQVVTNLRHASVSLRVPGCGKVPSLRDDVCGDGSRRFYNRTSAAPRCGACRAGVHSPGRGPGLTESASALRTSDAGLLPESLCRKRCGRRVQDCCLTDSCRFLWHSRVKSRSHGPMSEASSATRCRCVVLRPFDISHTSFLSTT